jgi:hypothetical protein
MASTYHDRIASAYNSLAYVMVKVESFDIVLMTAGMMEAGGNLLPGEADERAKIPLPSDS